VDSPGIVGTLCALGAAGLLLGYFLSSAWKWFATIAGTYFLLGVAGMLFYSKVGKLALRERLLDKICWEGNETVLDVGCGRGLLTVGAAHRLSSGKVVGVDVWQPGTITGNRADAVFENARLEGVADRVEVRQGDARDLPFEGETFDVVVSNYVVHELKTRNERTQMMHEIARVLKPGGRVALVDFIFTGECAAELQSSGVKAERLRDGFLSFWIAAVLNFGAVKTYHVVGQKIERSNLDSATP
jgi:ubiquinone/menaquinone biosynthesis C-methylase UbiE